MILIKSFTFSKRSMNSQGDKRVKMWQEEGEGCKKMRNRVEKILQELGSHEVPLEKGGQKVHGPKKLQDSAHVLASKILLGSKILLANFELLGNS